MASSPPMKEIRPIPFLHPTQAIYSGLPHAYPSPRKDTGAPSIDDVVASESAFTCPADKKPLPGHVQYKWTSRDNRKGRHTLVLPRASSHNVATPPPTTTFKATLHGLWRMLTYYPYWDISYLVAVFFTLGSLVWVLNSFFVFLPLANPRSNFPGEVLYGGGITAFIGVIIFEIGGALAVLEAVNENRERCFGWAVARLYAGRKSVDGENDDDDDAVKILPVGNDCSHDQESPPVTPYELQLQPPMKLLDPKPMHTYSWHPVIPSRRRRKRWVWWPSPEALRMHHSRSIGFLASLILFVSATIFFISGFTSLPGIINTMNRTETCILYWVPQLIGGVGFVVSGWMFMIETQQHWWKPAVDVLGWHVGFWNFVGGIGFLLCPCFGFDSQPWAQYQACLATLWGSWAFLIGSVVQWYECLEKNPVVVARR
ncbi:unnamed protein product [Zymoseptoria tritici ST99CH_3D7]|uniref:Integral membrane protein n=1 Tax=Zymoseptoria tritici (strain ST99CH_3D7) TaxID=1276538 RepID=A0A1X7RLM4_ZYMT9|nr:unnamed protein product [Zymoseptoria tritici ST99CH_3D7]